MWDVRALIPAAESRREVCYVSENTSLCFRHGMACEKYTSNVNSISCQCTLDVYDDSVGTHKNNRHLFVATCFRKLCLQVLHVLDIVRDAHTEVSTGLVVLELLQLFTTDAPT